MRNSAKSSDSLATMAAMNHQPKNECLDIVERIVLLFTDSRHANALATTTAAGLFVATLMFDVVDVVVVMVVLVVADDEGNSESGFDDGYKNNNKS